MKLVTRAAWVTPSGMWVVLTESRRTSPPTSVSHTSPLTALSRASVRDASNGSR
jgi:hypothetical protein